MNLEDFDKNIPIDKSTLRLEDRWILSRLQDLIGIVNEGFAKYQMDDPARWLYTYLWNYFCDWYIELAKPRLRGETKDRICVQKVLYTVLETSMRLLHPIMPFITEEIWQALPHNGESIMVSPFPERDDSLKDMQAEIDMETVMNVVTAIRSLRAEVGVALSKQINVVAVSTYARDLIEPNIEFIKNLAKVREFTFMDSIPEEDINKYVSAHQPMLDLYVEVAGLVDLDKELARIDSELASINKELARVTGKLSNEQFTSKAPAEIVEKERGIQSELQDKKTKLEDRKKALGGNAK